MSAVTLEQVEALAMQLPAPERLKLAARICEQVGSNMSEDDSQGIDTAEVIRQMRDERITAICQNDASTPASP